MQPVDQSVSLEITLPKGATLTSPIGPKRVDDGERQVVVEDQAKGDRVIKRKVAIPAGRIQPSEYGKFVDFARRADDALLAGMRVKTK